MGCIMTKRAHPMPSSAAFLLELNPYLFKVANVDDSGEEQNHGLLEVKDHELLFHQASSLTVLRNGSCRSNGTANGSVRGNDPSRGFMASGTENPPPIRWPLKSLRRYGFDADLFSFESGRRCATGPGIYAFRCDRAETLFNLVQDSIIRLGQAEEEEAARRRLMQSTNQSSGFRGRVAGGSGASPNMTSFARRGDLQNQQRVQFNRSISTPCREGDRNYINDKGPHDYLNQQLTGNGDSLPDRHSNYYVNRDVDQTNNFVQYAQLMVPPRTRSGSLGTADGGEDDDYDEERDCFDADLPHVQVNKYVNLSKVDASVFEGHRSASVPARFRRGDVSPSLANPRSAPVARVAPLRNYINMNDDDHQSGTKAPDNLINYIQLDLDGGSESNGDGATGSSGPDSNGESVRRGALKSDSGIQRSPRGAAGGSVGDSYATIDLQRTRAISCKAALAESVDEGSRKTRHNSNIES